MVFWDENGDSDVATGAVISAMYPSLVTERIALRSFSVESYVLYTDDNGVSNNAGDNWLRNYRKGAVTQLCDIEDRVELNRFFEYQFSDAIYLLELANTYYIPMKELTSTVCIYSGLPELSIEVVLKKEMQKQTVQKTNSCMWNLKSMKKRRVMKDKRLKRPRKAFLAL
ncbi:hypothetical protein BD408DRAFT_433651 [Parasitella parasitica]|nr:hypothetical protein BD408DRAFT_433651 [Parasitella parasitica]